MSQPTTEPTSEGWASKWPDWVNLILAAWLFITTFFLAIPMAASWNAWIVTVVIAIVALWAAGQRGGWQEWVNLILGAWLFISPWIYGFAANSAASWDHWIVGALIAIVSALSLGAQRGMLQRPM